MAGPESANNAAAQTCFIPLLTLGIPTGAVMALMVGAMTIQGIAPGPQVMTQKPDLFWGMIASMWIGNAMLVIAQPAADRHLGEVPENPLSHPVPRHLPVLLHRRLQREQQRDGSVPGGGLRVSSATSPSKWGCEPAPLLLGFVLGPLMEENLRRAMLISRGDPSVFFTRPISCGMLLVAAALLLIIVCCRIIRKKREEVLTEERRSDSPSPPTKNAARFRGVFLSSMIFGKVRALAFTARQFH